MAETKGSVLERFAVQAISGGANRLKIEYDEGYEEVYALHVRRSKQGRKDALLWCDLNTTPRALPRS